MFKVDKPNKWLAHMAEKYPDDAAGFDDVSNHIDHLRGQNAELRRVLGIIQDWCKSTLNITSDKGTNNG